MPLVLAVFVLIPVQLEICPVVPIRDLHLFSFLNRLVQGINIMEQVRIFRGVRRHAAHVVHPLVEIGARKLPKIVNQLFPLLVGHGPGKQQAVDQHMQLRFRNIRNVVHVGVKRAFLFLAGLRIPVFPDPFIPIDVIIRRKQVLDIAFDRRPVDLDPVFALQLFNDFLLRHAVIRVRVFPEDLQNVDDTGFLAVLLIHVQTPLSHRRPPQLFPNLHHRQSQTFTIAKVSSRQ